MLSQANKPANWSQKINIIHFNLLKCLSQLDKGAIKIHFRKKLGIWPYEGRGGLTEAQVFVEIVQNQICLGKWPET